MEKEKFIVDILENIGGKENITEVTHCVTRLRFTLKNMGEVNEEKLKCIDGVMGIVNKGKQFQIVIGPQVASVYKALIEYVGMEEKPMVGENETVAETSRKMNQVSLFFETVAGIFNPIVPALAGAGFVKAILTIAVLLGLSNESNTYYVINTIANGIFTFLPFLLAMSAAKQFRMNQGVALAICAAMLSPNWATLIAEGTQSFSFLNIPFNVTVYTSSVLPIIFTIWFASIIERLLEKVTPNVVKIIVVPALTMLIATPIALLTIGPAASWIGNLLAGSIALLFEKAGAFAGLFYGAIYSSMVVLGVHHGMLPVLMQGIATQGFNYLSPVSGSMNSSQAGACFGVWLRTKNLKTKQIGAAASISALAGVSEPAIYGVSVKLKKPFLAAAIGSACGGGFSSFFALKAYAIGGPSFVNFAMFIGDDPQNVWLVMLGFVISFAVAAVATCLLGFEQNA